MGKFLQKSIESGLAVEKYARSGVLYSFWNDAAKHFRSLHGCQKLSNFHVCDRLATINAGPDSFKTMICNMRFCRKALSGAVMAVLLSLVSCSGVQPVDEHLIYVSIAPLKTLVEQIVGDDFQVKVLVPQGSSPETYEPTPKQFIELGSASFVFSVGLLDFEKALLERLEHKERVYSLSEGIEVIAGSCSHHHAGHKCSHGVDPHVWCAPREIMQMSRNAFDAIRRVYPDSVKYAQRFEALQLRLEELDLECAQLCSHSSKKYFLIYHPALTYFARDYSLNQVSIQNDGKEASAKRLKQIIVQAREDSITKVFYQAEFPRSSVEVVAEDIGAQPVEINPLSEDLFHNILQMAKLVTDNE